ncbi:hypothetical protein RRG08_039680 [Elysia crispata]|uniref:Uncharacterized protein n=1 Tax=Elysia crispata TaxID=231223 RepID=A0AAE0YAS6_9GAST|nr:hypothetical protein RRG08_039680 [Elysia crispata]
MKGLFQTTRRPTEQNPVMLLLVLYLAQFSAVTARKIREDNKMMVNSRNIHREIINRDYVRSIVPARSDGQHRVELKFSLFSLDEVNEKEQKMVTSGRLYLGWETKGSLGDGPSSGTSRLCLLTSRTSGCQISLWPTVSLRIFSWDIIVANSVTKDIQLGFDELPCRVSYTGIVDWRPATRLATSCSIDVTYFPFDVQVRTGAYVMSPTFLLMDRCVCHVAYFPFDRQTCDIVFETLITTTEEVVINLREDRAVNLHRYSVDGQWKLTFTRAYNFQTSPSQNGVVFTLYLERLTKFYILALGMPVFLISLTGTLVFALPSPSGEKMGLGMTVLLAYAVHLAVVFEKLPNISVQVSIFAQYLITLMTITCACIMLSVIILRLYHRPETAIVGPKTKTVIRVLRRVLCLSTTPARLESYDIAQNAISPAPQEIRPNSSSRSSMSDEQREMTWQEVASVLDWLLFLVTTLISLLATTVCIFTLQGRPDVVMESNFSQPLGPNPLPYWTQSTRS